VLISVRRAESYVRTANSILTCQFEALNISWSRAGYWWRVGVRREAESPRGSFQFGKEQEQSAAQNAVSVDLPMY